MRLMYQQRGVGECSEWHDARGALYVALLDCDEGWLRRYHAPRFAAKSDTSKDDAPKTATRLSTDNRA